MLALLLIMITLARLNAGCARQAVSAEGLLERQSSVIGLTGVFSRSGEHLRGALTMSYHDHGRMDQRCATTGCGAYYWKSEVQDQGKHLNCCWKRKEKKWTQSLPSAASRLYDDSAQCPAYAPREFSEFQASGVRGNDLYKNSRQYSNSFALASAQINYDTRNKPGGPISIQGKIHRYFPDAITPPNGKQPAFAQMYFVGDDQHGIRCRNLPSKTKATAQSMEFLHANLTKYHPYVNGTQCAAEFVRENPTATVKVVYDSSKIPAAGHKGTFNKPSSRQGATGVAAILADTAADRQYERGVVLQYKASKTTQRISYADRWFDPVHFTLLNPTGAPGWDNLTTSDDDNNESCLAFYKSRLTQRFRADDNGRDPCDQPRYTTWEMNPRTITLQEHMFTAGRTFQEYVIDGYTKHLDSSCSWSEKNQDKLRCKVRSTTARACAQSQATGDPMIGVKRTFLPKSHTGSPADYKERYQNALKLIQMKGKPDLFITMTCNPQWPEIQRELLPGECWENRMDLVARVFSMKRKNLIDVIRDGAFGSPATAIVAVTEFQKKSLPHVHILVCLETKLTTTAQFDAVVSAEIPSLAAPHLRQLVLKHMIHSPCEHDTSCPCRQGPSDDTGDPVVVPCQKFFPKPFQACTQSDPNDSYPEYMRRSASDGGQTGETPGTRRHPGVAVDNSWVVPYNPALLAMFDCHINVEVTSSIDCVKYLYKYVYKGTDRIMYKLRSLDGFTGDEIEEYRAARYLTATEAFFCIFFPQQRFTMWPPVLPLMVHTAESHPVTLSPEDLDNPDELQDAISKKLDEGVAPTQLTKYFEFCADAEPNDLCHTLTYEQFPEHYRWQTSPPAWLRRANKQIQIGRMLRLTPNHGEDYYARLLLSKTQGATGYDALLNGQDTYRGACLAAGHISASDDAHWDAAMRNSMETDTDFNVRHLFVMILQHCLPAHPRALYDRHCESLSKPYTHRGHATPENARIKLLLELHRLMDNSSFGLDSDRPIPPRPTADEIADITETSEKIAAKRRHAEALELISKDNDQLHVYDTIIRRIDRSDGKAYFLNAGGGCGKTTVMNCVLDWCIVNGHKALSTAMTGVAATLLERGVTFHSATGAFLKMPTKARSFGAGAETPVSKKLQMCRFLFVDEATMMHKVLLDSLDMTLRGLADANHAHLPFGGKVLVLAGDFRQQLPVTPRANPCEIIDSCAVNAKSWEHITTLVLNTNHRLVTNDDNLEFADLIDRIGRGVNDVVDGTDTSVELPQRILLDIKKPRAGDPKLEEGDRVDALIDWVYRKPPRGQNRASWLMSRRIVTPKNKTVDELNARIMDRFSGEEWTSYSEDSMEHGEATAASAVSADILHKQKPPGFPPHELRLQKGMPYMLTRNLDASLDLCNGTVVVIEDFSDMAVTVSVPGSRRIRHSHTIRIPRILFIPGEDDCPFFFRRRQFPLQPAMACTINKVQGQSLERTGVYLPKGCFGHGQLYVALSRATDMNGIRVLITENDECKSVTENTVYRAVIKAALGDSACSDYDAPKTARKPKRARAAQPLDATPIWTGISYNDMDMCVRQWDMETVNIPTNGYCGYIGISQQLQCSVPEAFEKLAAWAAMGAQDAYDGASDISIITGAAKQWDSETAKPMNSKDLHDRSLWFEYGWMFFCARGASCPVILVQTLAPFEDGPTTAVFMHEPFNFKHTGGATEKYERNAHPLDVAAILDENDRCICLTYNGSHFNGFGPIGSQAEWEDTLATYDADCNSSVVIEDADCNSSDTEQLPPGSILPDTCPKCTATSALRFAKTTNRRKHPFSERDALCSSCSATYAFCVPCKTLLPLPDKHVARHASRCPSAIASLAPLPATGTPAELPIPKLAEQPPVEHTLPDACPECALTSTLRFANKKNRRRRPFSERDVTCSSCSAAYAFCVPCKALFPLPDTNGNFSRHLSICPSANASLTPLPDHIAVACRTCSAQDSSLWFSRPQRRRKLPFVKFDVTCFMCSSQYALCGDCCELFSLPDKHRNIARHARKCHLGICKTNSTASERHPIPDHLNSPLPYPNSPLQPLPMIGLCVAPAVPVPLPQPPGHAVSLPCQTQQSPPVTSPAPVQNTTDSGLWNTDPTPSEWDFSSFLRASHAAGEADADDASSDDFSETDTDMSMDAVAARSSRYFDVEATEDRADGNETEA